MSSRGTLQRAYHDSLRRHGYQADEAQLQAVARLEDLRMRLARASGASWTERVRRTWRPAPPPVRGLYLWGGVGRGKTFLMDLLHSHLPVPSRREHFHRFMKDVHARLRELRECRTRSPGSPVELRARLACFASTNCSSATSPTPCCSGGCSPPSSSTA
jgi:predicted ATPase